jgi:hypothetical protein
MRMIHPAELARRLGHTGQAIQRLAAATSQLESQWRPQPESWSVLEVVNHLLDEEREDFRTRLDLVLHSPGEKWPPIHPGAWVTERGYNQRDLADSIRDFQEERTRSIEWLNGLGTVDAELAYAHPAGPMRAGDLMASWAGHDLLHLRQLVEINYALVRRESAPYMPDYAGEW